MKEKIKVFGIPFIVIAALLAALYFHQLSTMTKLPNEEWSRSVSLPYEGKEMPISFQRGNELYLTNADKVNKFVFGEGLTIEDSEELSMDIPRGYPFWTDGERFLTLSTGNLTLTQNGDGRVIDQDVTGLAAAEGKVLYWKSGTVYAFDIASENSTEIHRFPNEIIDIVLASDGSYAVVHQRDDANGEVFFVKSDGVMIESPVLAVKNSVYDKLGNVVMTTTEGKVSIVYGRQMRTGGSLSFNMYKASGPIDELESTPLTAQKLTFINKENDAKLESPDYANIVNLSDGPHLMFTAEGQRIGDNNAMRLYSGQLGSGTEIEALPVNTNNNVAQNPMKVNEESAVWISFNGDHYQLYGASQDADVKAASTELDAEDWKHSGYNAFLMLFSSMITVLTSFYWFLPSLTLLLTLYILRPNIFEKEDINWVEYASILIFLVMPFTYMNKAMNPYFYEMAPFYYTFPYSGSILLVLMSIVTAAVWKWGRDPEWGTFAGVFYFMLVYMLIYIFSVGPYIFNLF
jgi:hypothetical protein